MSTANRSRSQPPKQSSFAWSRFAWVAIILVFLLILMPFVMQIVAFWKYDSGTTVAIADQVKQQADQTQNLLNLINTFAAILGVIFAVFAAITVALGVYGFSTNNGFRDLEKDWQKRLEDLAQKSTAIDHLSEEQGRLGEDLQRKNQEIAQLTRDLQIKNDQLNLLQVESSHLQDQLRDQLRKNVTFAQASLHKQLEDFGAAVAYTYTFGGPTRNVLQNDPRINFTLGRLLSSGGNYDRAIDLLEAAAQIDPDFPDVHDELGLAYRRRGDRYNSAGDKEKGEVDYEKARQELLLAIQQNPRHIDALCVLGGLYRRKKEYEQAMQYYQQAVQIDPHSSYALGNVASLAWLLGDEILAREMFERTEKAARRRLDNLESLEPFWDYFDLGLAQLALGKTDAARTSYARAIELTPSKILFDGVLHNLSILQNASKGPPISGLDEVIQMIEKVR